MFFRQTEHCFSVNEQNSHKTATVTTTSPWQRIHGFLVYKKASFEQLGHIIYYYSNILEYLEAIMSEFFPFIHKIEKKKEQEPQPLYVELIPPPPPQKKRDDEEEQPRVVIIEL